MERLKLTPPVKSMEQLHAIASSGRSRLAKAAQAEIARRTLAGLRHAVQPNPGA